MSDKDNNVLKELGIAPERQSEFDSKTVAELSQEERELDVKLKRLELQERLEKSEAKQAKIAEKKREFEAKMKAISYDLARKRAMQRGCSHRKGGQIQAGSKGQLPLEGGDSDMFAVIKHQLPSGDWMIQCQRCGAEWLPADRFTGRPASIIGGITYRQALAFRSDNTPSKSCVFNFRDLRSPEQKEADAWKQPRNDKGELIEDDLGKPLAEQDGPPAPVHNR